VSKRKRPSAGADPGEAASGAVVGTVAPPEASASSFPVVGIGASAGGLAAFEAFFSAMPPDEPSGMAFVLIQHLSPDHASVLVDIVRRYTKMRVEEAAHGMRLEPNCTYVIPPGHDLEIEDNQFQLTRHTVDRKPRLTVDRFFESLARTQRERAIGIVMSGAGSDGTLGLRAVKDGGGLAIAQTPDTTDHDSMPRSAIATGLVDFVLAPADMPAKLVSYVHHAFDRQREKAAGKLGDGLLHRLCEQLRAQTGHDFSQYKETTLVRRVERRMALHQVAHADEYLRYARENPPEVEALFRDLLIGVTNFFRDPPAFATLEETVLPRLLEKKTNHDPVRVWVCGCSTGEEAYSIAILLYEQAIRLRKPLKIQVFATDIDRVAIEQARSGIYPASIAADLSEERLARFFAPDARRGTYRIQKHIRDLLVFSEQDVIKDPPFSKLDLISCRNLLIYFNSDLQRKLIPLFHYALVPGGALFLGTSETVGEHARLFHVVDRKWKLYTRATAGGPRPELPSFVPSPAHRGPGDAAEPSFAVPEDPGTLRQITERALLAHYAQAGVLINGRGQILHIVGRTGKFLEPADGDAELNVLHMAREGLRRDLTVALHKAVSHREVAWYPGIRIKANGAWIRANLAVRPVEAGGSTDLYLVVLEELPVWSDLAEVPDVPDEASSRVSELERELRAQDEYLQTTLEEMETTTEELKSTNEEMQSVNEELQSTNEELETSKEELQSLNEELSTVNAELQDKILDLSQANNDMNNLLAGTGVGTLFVDQRLRIARFTPAATQVINLIASDVGRPLEHVAHNLVGYDRMADDIREVLETLAPKETEVQAKGGAWYLMLIRPYRTMDDRIEGAVITLIDITGRKRTEESLRRSDARLKVLDNYAFGGVSETDPDGRYVFANEWLCRAFGLTRDEMLRMRLADLTDPQDLLRYQAGLDALLAGGPELRINRRCVGKDGRRFQLHERISAVRDAAGNTTSLLTLSFDRDDAH
jgi:two-component system CheB/CheR fusion protein